MRARYASAVEQKVPILSMLLKIKDGDRKNLQAARIAEQKCTLTSPHGRLIEVPYALFEAFEELAGRNGRIEIDVRHGGVAGVRTQKVLK